VVILLGGDEVIVRGPITGGFEKRFEIVCEFSEAKYPNAAQLL
jgi:hypothetical protein